MKNLLCVLASCLIIACGSPPATQVDPLSLTWPEVLEEASGQTMHMMMWQGNPSINAYMQDFVVPAVRDSFGIELKLVNGQGKAIVSALQTELEAGLEESELDLVWINGETFFQLREISALYGPFLNTLPNSKYLNLEDPFIKYDFQQEIDGFECPWGNVQMTLIYDSLRTPEPPQTFAALMDWATQNPGRFTISNEFTGMSFMKAVLIGQAGGGTNLDGPFDPATYETLSTKLWETLNAQKVHFWQNGETFPGTLSAMHQMFAQGELDFTMSMNDTEVDNKIMEGVFPKSARAYVWETGTIRNSHFVGIPGHSGHKAAAMVVANFLISPAAQLRKADPATWGDGTVLDLSKLPANWQEQFRQLPNRRYAPERESIRDRALKEPDPQYMIRLYEDFRQFVIES